jgi:RYK receptor-like tyrosine kinase
VSTHQAVCIGLQLLTALKHIHKRRIIHRDVAARNCYLTPNLSVKLCDPALSRDLFPNDYHCLGDNENRPVKWMAMESISTGHFSRASDMWSWAIFLWEVLTRAQQPFPDIDPFEMEAYLAEGFRLHQPLNCPDQLYTVMVSCWAHNPHHRASVQTLYTHLMDFNTQLQQFV